jgi:hypothetical protein
MERVRLETSKMRFRVKDVPGAGNCLFEAVGRNVGVDASELRRTAVEWMLMPNQKLHGEELSLWIQNGAEIPLSKHDPVGSYVAHMRKSGVWGGGIELAVLATLLHRPVLVYAAESSDPGKASRVAEFLPDGPRDEIDLLPAVCILYVGRAHYMQLVLDS